VIRQLLCDVGTDSALLRDAAKMVDAQPVDEQQQRSGGWGRSRNEQSSGARLHHLPFLSHERRAEQQVTYRVAARAAPDRVAVAIGAVEMLRRHVFANLNVVEWSRHAFPTSICAALLHNERCSALLGRRTKVAIAGELRTRGGLEIGSSMPHITIDRLVSTSVCGKIVTILTLSLLY
jgi:hypothetical protein